MYLILTSLIYLRDVQRKKVAGIANYESVHRDRVSRAKTNTAQQETMNTKHEHEVFVTTVSFLFTYILLLTNAELPPWYGQLFSIGGLNQISA